LILAAGSAGATPNQADDAKVLRAYTQQLLDAVAPGEKGPWEKLLSPNFLHMDEQGRVQTKPELLKDLQPLPPGLSGQLRIDTFRVLFEHDIAIVAHEDQEQLDYHGQMLHSRFRSLDTWKRTPAGWRMIGEHTAAVLKDPAAVAVPWTDTCDYAGKYRLDPSIEVAIVCTSEGLVAIRPGRPDTKFRMESPDVFFAPGQPRTRRIFQRGAGKRIAGFVDRREGEDVRWNKIG
jgi:hypothetical protein